MAGAPGLVSRGQCVRWAAIVIAAPLTADNTLGALLIVPIAVLARLISYIGMFLALRSAMPGYRMIAGGDVRSGPSAMLRRSS